MSVFDQRDQEIKGIQINDSSNLTKDQAKIMKEYLKRIEDNILNNDWRNAIKKIAEANKYLDQVINGNS